MKITIGIRYMLIATFFFAIMNVGAKYLTHIPPVEIVFFRSLITFIISYSVLRIRKIRVFGKKENRKWLLVRGLAGALALTLYYTTLQTMPLASAVKTRGLKFPNGFSGFHPCPTM